MIEVFGGIIIFLLGVLVVEYRQGRKELKELIYSLVGVHLKRHPEDWSKIKVGGTSND